MQRTKVAATQGGTREKARTAVRTQFLEKARPGADATLDGLWGKDRREAFRQWPATFGDYGSDVLHQATQCLMIVSALRPAGSG